MTEDLKVPKIEVQVRMAMMDGEMWEGALSLARASMRHQGPEQVMDLLQQKDPYIPVHVEEQGWRLLHRDRIVMVSIDQSLGLAELDPANLLDKAGRVVDVRIRLISGETLTGGCPILPESGHSIRLLDWVNEQPGFFPLLEGASTLTYVNHAAVAWIEEENKEEKERTHQEERGE